MGQRLAAGFPIVGYQGRVRQILAAGLSVKMYVQQGLVGEEEAGIEDVTNSEGSNSNLSSKKATKGPVKMKRVGLRPVTRACPVIPRVRAVGGERVGGVGGVVRLWDGEGGGCWVAGGCGGLRGVGRGAVLWGGSDDDNRGYHWELAVDDMNNYLLIFHIPFSGFDEDEDDVFTAMSGQWVMGLAYDASGYRRGTAISCDI